MNSHMLLNTACTLTLLAVVACDPQVDGVDLEVADRHELLADADDARLAADDDDDADDVDDADDADDVDDADAMSVDASLDLADAPDGARASCWTGSQEFSYTPSGTCGGCKINNVYPGQKWVERVRFCYAGTWGPWLNGVNQCLDC